MSANRWGFTLLVVAVMLATTGLGADAQVPTTAQGTAGVTVPYPGWLSDAEGQPVADGAYELRFALYAAATGGQPLWTETQTGVAVRGGTFAVVLGSVAPIPSAVLGGGARWLEVSVRGLGEVAFTTLEPRQEVQTAAPAAVRQASSCAHDHGGERWDAYNVDSAGLMVFVQSASIANPAGIYGSDGGTSAWFPVSTGVSGASGDGAGVGGYSPNGSGIYGRSNSGDGVRGESNNWFGVYGKGLTGVVGTTDIDGSNGIFAEHTGAGFGLTATSAEGFGLQAGGLDTSYWDGYGDILLGGNYGEIFAGGILLNLYSNRHMWMHLDNDNNDAQATYRIYNGDDTVLWSVSEPTGDVIAAGSQASAVETADHGQRLLYAVEGTGVWLEDVGTAALGKGGEVTIAFDPVYAQAANVEGEYQVFVTALGEQFVLLQVAAKTATGFTVRGVTLDGKPATCRFDYRVVAPRAGYEDVRLEQVTLDGKEQP
jgi:hypothetical protein